MPEFRTCVTFRCTGFNTTEEHDYFINPGNFGDDLALWLMDQLEKRGFSVDRNDEGKPGQEDFGWYLGFGAAGVPHTVLLASYDTEKQSWWAQIERDAGFIASFLGGRNRGIRPEAPQALHDVLSSSPQVSEIRWQHKKTFEPGSGSGTPTPLG